MAKKKTETADKIMTLTEKERRLAQITESINNKYKKPVVGNLLDPEIRKQIEIDFIPSASPDFNINTGGGFPIGKMSIVSGLSDSGKTGLMLNTVGMNMQQDPNFTCLWLESEDSLAKMDYLEHTFGIDPARFYVVPLQYSMGGEAALDDLLAFVSTGAISLCVINTLRAIIPTSEIQKPVEAQDVALSARMNSRFVSKVIPLLSETKTTLVCIQQRTTNIGGYGQADTLSGGLRIRYHSMLTVRLNRLKVAAEDPIKPEEGIKVSVIVEKNHCIPQEFQYKKFVYYAIYNEGIETILSTLQLAIEQKVIQRRGAHLYYYGDKDPDKDDPIYHWTSKSDFRAFMKEHPDILEEFSNKVQRSGESLSTTEISAIQAEARADARAAGVDIDEPDDMTKAIIDTQTKED